MEFVGYNNSTLRKFFKDVAFRIIARSAVNIRALILLPIIAKHLGPDQYGIYSQVTITITLFSPILLLGLRESFVRYFAAEKDSVIISSVFTAMLTIVFGLALLFSCAIAVWQHETSSLMFGSSGYPLYVKLFGLYLLLVVISNFTLNYYKTFKHIPKFSVVEVVRVCLEIGLLIFIGIFYSLDLLTILTVMIVLEAMVILFLVVDIYSHMRFSLRKITNFSKYFKYGLPLIASDILWWIVELSDRYLLTHFLDLNSTGIYSAYSVIGKIPVFLILPISFVLIPTLSQFWVENKNQDIKKFIELLLRTAYLVSIPSAFCLYYFSPFLIQKLCGQDFVTNNWLMFYILFSSTIFAFSKIIHVLIYLSEKTQFFLYILIFVAPLNLLLNIKLIPLLGINGAALSTFICFSIYVVAVWIYCGKIMVFSSNMIFLCKVILSSIVAFMCLSIFRVENAIDFGVLSLLGLAVYLFLLITLKGIRRTDWNSICFLLKGGC